jgi:DNA-binding MarR family transcriptional regulator
MPHFTKSHYLWRVRTSRSDYQKLAAFRYAVRRFLRFSEQAAAEVGLTPQQNQALLAIEGFPERNYASIRELAERLQLAHHSVVGLLDRLETAGLVNRTTSPKDKRIVLVRVSRKGQRLLRSLTRAHKAQLRQLGPEMIRSLEGLR